MIRINKFQKNKVEDDSVVESIMGYRLTVFGIPLYKIDSKIDNQFEVKQSTKDTKVGFGNGSKG